MPFVIWLTCIFTPVGLLIWSLILTWSLGG
jgi:hypothetical protein